MNGSILIAHIHEARDLKRTAGYFAEVLFDDQKFSTQLKAATIRPVWNEKFTFDVIKGTETIVFNLYSDISPKAALATCEFSIAKLLPPEYSFDDWIPLKSKGAIEGQVKLSLQWIVSRVEYFNNIINKLEREIVEHKNQQAMNEQKLEMMHRICITLLCRAFRFPQARNSKKKHRKKKRKV